jgi:SOS-response transcriptional repressor LexA
MLPTLTRFQQKAMMEICHYRSKHGVSPSCEELADILGLQFRGAAHHHINKLVEKGYLLRHKKDIVTCRNESRSIKPAHTIGSIPVVGTCN